MYFLDAKLHNLMYIHNTFTHMGISVVFLLLPVRLKKTYCIRFGIPLGVQSRTAAINALTVFFEQYRVLPGRNTVTSFKATLNYDKVELF